MQEMKVELLAYTKCATDIVDQAASLCVGKKPDGRSFKHALASGHDSVLEHVSYTFKVTDISRSCSHQLVRHRLASYSQQSQRYVKTDELEFVVPPTVHEKGAFKQYRELMQEIGEIYYKLLDMGVPQEDARYVLPNACTTSIIITMNGRELMHFFNLRCCNRAQWEIRELANKMKKLCVLTEPELFKDAGPSCTKYGVCTEAKSCGKCPKITDVMKEYHNL